MARSFSSPSADGEVVAYLHFGVGERGPELSRIYAGPKAFGTGAGTALLDELHRRLDVRGIGSYVLDVHSRNVRGRAFYDRRVSSSSARAARPTATSPWRTSIHRDPAFLSRPIVSAAPARGHRRRRGRLHAIYGDAETMRYIGPRVARPRISRRRAKPFAGWFGTRSSTASASGPSTSAPGSRSSRCRPRLGRGPRSRRRGRLPRAPRPMGPRIRHRGPAGRPPGRVRSARAAVDRHPGLPGQRSIAPRDGEGRHARARDGQRAYSRELTRHVATP